MQKEGLSFALTLIILLSALACIQRGDYLTVADGAKYEYAVELCREGKCEEEKFTTYYDGEEIINGKKYLKLYASYNGGDVRLISYDRKAKEGLFSVLADHKDQLEQLTVPIHLKIGEIHTFKLREEEIKERTLVGKETLSLSDKKYENCLIFSTITHAEGSQKDENRDIDYLAPNIGCVKFIMHRNHPIQFIATGTLTKYEPPNGGEKERRQSFISLARVFNLFQSKSSNVVGKWVPRNLNSMTDDISIDFFKDKTAIYHYNMSGSITNCPAQWNIYDDGRIKLDIAFPGGFQSLMGSLKQGALSLDIGEPEGTVVFVKNN